MKPEHPWKTLQSKVPRRLETDGGIVVLVDYLYGEVIKGKPSGTWRARARVESGPYAVYTGTCGPRPTEAELGQLLIRGMGLS
jgi:hypothetical protein